MARAAPLTAAELELVKSYKYDHGFETTALPNLTFESARRGEISYIMEVLPAQTNRRDVSVSPLIDAALLPTRSLILTTFLPGVRRYMAGASRRSWTSSALRPWQRLERCHT